MRDVTAAAAAAAAAAARASSVVSGVMYNVTLIHITPSIARHPSIIQNTRRPKRRWVVFMDGRKTKRRTNHFRAFALLLCCVAGFPFGVVVLLFFCLRPRAFRRHRVRLQSPSALSPLALICSAVFKVRSEVFLHVGCPDVSCLMCLTCGFRWCLFR